MRDVSIIDNNEAISPDAIGELVRHVRISLGGQREVYIGVW